MCVLIKSQTKISHKILCTEILHAPGVLNFGRVYIAAVKKLVFSTVISGSQTGDPSKRQQLVETEGIPRHYVFFWLHHNGEGSFLPALIIVTLACNKHFSFMCVCICVCVCM